MMKKSNKDKQSRKTIDKNKKNAAKIEPSGVICCTIEQLLCHCSTLDIKPYEELNGIDYEAILDVKHELGCTYEMAEKVAYELQMNQLNGQIEELLKDGLLEISGIDASGELLFTSSIPKKINSSKSKKKTSDNKAKK